MAKQSIWFIINPISGGKNKNKIPSLVEKHLNLNKFEYKCLQTTSAAHTLQLAQKAIEENVSVLVAVGGDGTINNLAQFAKNSNTLFAIIALGSGNGFARALHIYGSVKRALQIINQGKTQWVDSASINNEFFLNLSGIGFDAHVGSLFAGSVKRGLKSYLKIIWKELIHFKTQTVQIDSDLGNRKVSIFMLSICNGPQFGNNAFIAPNAKLDDALLDITIVREFAKWKIPFIALCILFKKIHWVKEIEQFKTSYIHIHRQEPGFVNIDGEPVWMDKELQVQMHPKSLQILVP